MSVWDLYDSWKLKGFDDGFDDDDCEEEETDVKEEYKPRGVKQMLAHVVEECGELQAALGKTLRWGLDSVNPELPVSEQETNEDWVLRESWDVLNAIVMLRRELHRNPGVIGDLYGDRDIMALDRAGNFYCNHLMALTRESLHDKSAIAAELAHRDYQISVLSMAAESAPPPQTEEELLSLMPSSWVELIKGAKTLKAAYAADGVVTDNASKHLVFQALGVTNYCPQCQGEGTISVCGNIDDCACGQRNK
jgi:hypothetical protein